mmetsp:Transcript_9804/g.19259  ORF Transcript_9804/g.19259 Transcript_9804/m.19259 type:complete len:570 (-) Transcript_9804:654-2363(-)|eukprot:CAMPEP_0171504374 /NCGR_PEP_ID=MMETSP0958-20121227/11537_1 /TAXON_ID=87120 /ORGANISM="Aurantiochytrium limacinum, Strain ATCCMYA-1381" /LENGTH=569 /DNA_ID=CAMNT_0012040211 /DNA_START=612 /DNA_END=2321 /DNA_ORIENTATION=-
MGGDNLCDRLLLPLKKQTSKTMQGSKNLVKNLHGAVFSRIPAPFSRFIATLLRCLDSCLWALIKFVYTEMKQLNIRLVIAVCIYLALFSVVMTNIRYSSRFRPSLSTIENIEDQRTQWARDFVATYGGELLAADSVAASEEQNLPLCIAIPTAERRHSFLLQSVATVVRSMVRSEEGNFVLIVNDVAKRRSLRTDPTVSFLEQHGVNVIHSSPCFKKGTSCSSRQKSVLDMATTIEGCLTMTTARYIVLLEDDMVVSAHFVERVLRTARDLSMRRDPWAFVSLFRTNYYDGFSRNFDSIVELVGWGVSVTFILLTLVHYCFRFLASHQNKPSEFTLKNFMLRLICYSVLTIASIYMLGRQNIIQPLLFEEGLFVDASNPSTAGLLFPRDSAEQFAAWLQTPDLDVDKSQAAVKFAELHEVPSYLLRPNPIEHVGRFTSIAAKRTKREISEPMSHFINYMKVSEWFEEDDSKVDLRSPRDLSHNLAGLKEGLPASRKAADSAYLRAPMENITYVATSYFHRIMGFIFISSSMLLIMIMGQADGLQLGELYSTCLSLFTKKRSPMSDDKVN